VNILAQIEICSNENKFEPVNFLNILKDIYIKLKDIYEKNYSYENYILFPASHFYDILFVL
jgi:hypothetical protein